MVRLGRSLLAPSALFLTVLLSIGLAPARSAVVLYVDDDAPGDPGPNDSAISDPIEDGSLAHPFDRIQEAIDAAAPGDTVHVVAGSYTEALVVYDGRSVTVAGEGISVTIVRGLLDAPVVREHADVNLSFGTDIEISNMTLVGRVGVAGHFSTRLRDLDMPSFSIEGTFFAAIDGAYLQLDHVTGTGGGITLSGSGSVSLSARHFTAPTSSVYMSIFDASPRLEMWDSVVSSASLNSGRGLFADFESVRFTGAGISATSGSTASIGISHCTFDDGGITLSESCGPEDTWGGSLNVSHSTFARYGILFETIGSPGVSLTDKYVILDGDSFHGDGAHLTFQRRAYDDVGFGGTTYLYLLAINNVFAAAGIEATLDYMSPPPASLMGALVADIRAVNDTLAGAAAGLSVTTTTHPAGVDQLTTTLQNNILAFGSQGIRIDGTVDQAIAILNNDLFDNSSADYVGIPDQTGLNGNIAADPRFVEPMGNDYHLRAISPCIDAGAPGNGTPAVDHDGVQRPRDGDGDGLALPDIGAYELAPSAGGDRDGDGTPDALDCDPNDPSVSSQPSDVADVQADAAGQVLTWSPPIDAGGTGPLGYDALLADGPGGFSTALCLESGAPDQQAPISAWTPPAGRLYFFVVRARNACGGLLGTDSAGQPRAGRQCP